jgi:hypothetical protein
MIRSNLIKVRSRLTGEICVAQLRSGFRTVSKGKVTYKYNLWVWGEGMTDRHRSNTDSFRLVYTPRLCDILRGWHNAEERS